MKTSNVYNKAFTLSNSFVNLRLNALSNKKYRQDKLDEIDTKFNQKMAELEAQKKNSIVSVKDKIKLVNSNVDKLINKLKNSELKIHYFSNESRSNSNQAKEPDFEELKDSIDRINELYNSSSFGDSKTESQLSQMLFKFYKDIREGINYYTDLRNNNSYRANKKIDEIEQDFKKAKEEAINKKKKFIEDINSMCDSLDNQSKDELKSLIESSDFKELDKNVCELRKKLADNDDSFEEFVSQEQYPSEILIGYAAFPFELSKNYSEYLKEKMPSLFSDKNELLVPLAHSTEEPMNICISYSIENKEKVMEGIQSIILKWLKFMPLDSYSLTYIDPIDRGSNLGVLQRLEDITAYDICNKVYADWDTIGARLAYLKHFISESCTKFAIDKTIYNYNKNHADTIKQHFIVINDYPKNIDVDSLEILIKNSKKCGLNIIITSPDKEKLESSELLKTFTHISADTDNAKIEIDGKTSNFIFSKPCKNAVDFIEKVKDSYAADMQVDNSFENFFDLSSDSIYRDSSESIRIPFAVSSHKETVELELGGPLCAHALLSGATGSGKSTTLHTIITSIILNYHPDDVELWLVDYNKVEFAEYIENMPPHIKFIGLENGKEFTYSLLDKINEEFLRRIDLFKEKGVSSITEYKKKFGVNSIPRIIFIVDEFHQMTQAVSESYEYRTLLENILSEYRKFGLTCLFSDQAISDGLKGLTDKGKKQIRVRLAMANELEEVKQTLALSDSNYFTADLIRKIDHMDKGDLIYKSSVKNQSGSSQTSIDCYRTIYCDKNQRNQSIDFACHSVSDNYKQKDVIIAASNERKNFVAKEIDEYEKMYGAPTNDCLPIYLGTPENLNPVFCFNIEEELASNIILVGSDMNMRTSVIYYTVKSFKRLKDSKIYIFADSKDKLFKKYHLVFESLVDSKCFIHTDVNEISKIVHEHNCKKNENVDEKVLFVWIGLESIEAEMKILSNSNSHGYKVNELRLSSNIQDITNKFSSFTSTLLDSSVHSYNSKEDTEIDNEDLDVIEDIEELFAIGSKYSIHQLVTFSSVKSLNQASCVKIKNFENKIGFAMNKEDWIDYFGTISYIADIDDISAVYYDGGGYVRKFKPYKLEKGDY